LAQPARVDLEFVDQQAAHLRVAVLLDHEDLVVVGDEVAPPSGRGRPQPHRVHVDASASSTSSASRMAGAVLPK
jgi:hypothetical protein